MSSRWRVNFTRLLDSPEDLHWTVKTSLVFYLAHLLCEGWIGTSQGFLAIAVIAAVVAMARRKLRVQWHPLYIPLGLYLVASTISATLAVDPWFSLREVSDWFTFLSFPLGLTLYRTSPRSIRAAIVCLLILVLFQGLYGLGQYYILGRQLLENRISGTAAHVMTYSGILLPISLMSILLALERRRPLATATALVSCLALLLTFTRGAWIGWLAGVLAVLLLRRSRWLAYGVPVLILAITVSPLPLFGRLISSFDVNQSSNLDRIRMAQAGVEMIKDYPFFGVGPGNVKEIYPLYREPDAPRFRIPHLHNNVVQIWAERGLLALAAYLFLVGAFLALCLRDGGFWSQVGVAVAVSLFFAGLFEFNFGDSEVLLTMLDVFAVVCAILERPRNDPPLESVLAQAPADSGAFPASNP